MVVVVDDEKGNDRWSGAGRLPPQVATPESSRYTATVNGNRVTSSSQHSSVEMNGVPRPEQNGAGSQRSDYEGSVTSLRIV